ncbi:hydroxysteroid dehydrogenase-like protein 1 [Uranotaenia lowii]|uniref:hydroxysteroid dehydrogenase-like protein 1 n=1 Tax=Uranotaenia lowii TaxID=190385 RepID=UPI00247A3BFC|nr:hydroxysteroid dehydrogenase-like protein 1 [Uranotaenia lowii]
MEQDCSYANVFLQVIGALVLVAWIYRTFKSGLAIVWGSLKDLVLRRDWKQKYGKWAVVSGGSDGIGRQISILLAKQGLNIIIIARPDDNLQTTADQISSDYGVQVKTVGVDFANGWQLYSFIQKELDGFDIGVLVNNAGILLKIDSFENIAYNEHQTMVNVNINAALMLTHIVTPYMKSRRKGLIVNIASISAYTPAPYALMYAATKSFIYSFSRALTVELKESGVKVQTITPSFVETKLTKKMHTSQLYHLTTVHLDSFANSLGIVIGKTELTTGHWYHAVQHTLSSWIPIEWRMKLFEKVSMPVINGENMKTN